MPLAFSDHRREDHAESLDRRAVVELHAAEAETAEAVAVEGRAVLLLPLTCPRPQKIARDHQELLAWPRRRPQNGPEVPSWDGEWVIPSLEGRLAVALRTEKAPR